MQIAENDEACFRCEITFEFPKPEAEALLRAAFEPIDICSNVIKNCQHRIISGPLHQNLVTSLDERGQRDEVCHRSSQRVDDTLRWHLRLRGQSLYQGLVAIGTSAANLKVSDADR